MMTVGQLRQLEQAADHCGHCELRGDRLFVCQYHEGWGDALDAARFPALLDIAEAAQEYEVASEALQQDDPPEDAWREAGGRYEALRAALSRLEGATDVD